MCSIYPGIKLEPALGTLEDKIEHLSSYAHVVHTTAEQVISHRRKNENVFKMSKDEKCMWKACKNTVFHCQICKFARFLLPPLSWLLKLPINDRALQSAISCSTLPFALAYYFISQGALWFVSFHFYFSCHYHKHLIKPLLMSYIKMTHSEWKILRATRI